MQNDPHFLFLPSALGALENAFELATAHARATAPRGTAAMPAACPVSRGDPSEATDVDGEPLLDGLDLLRAVREPLEWLLTLAHRLAGDEPEEVAAIDRLRAVFHARLAGRAIGVRHSDVLIGFALLIGALDPAIVLEGVRRTIADGVATLLTCEGLSVAAQIASIADRVPVAVHPARTPAHARARARRGTRL